MEKVIRCNCRNVFIFIACLSAVIAGAVFAGGAIHSKQRDTLDSRRDAEYSRQMGYAVGIIAELDYGIGSIHSGLRDIQNSLAEIAQSHRSDAGNLRFFAQRLFAIADTVEKMEAGIPFFRDRAWSFLDNVNYKNGSELNNDYLKGIIEP